MASFLSHVDKGVYTDVVIIIRTTKPMSAAQAYTMSFHLLANITLKFLGEAPFGKWKENRVIN